MLQSILWHVRILSIVRILNHGQAAISFYPPQPGAPVIHGAAQYHTNHAFTVRYRCRPEKRINRRPMKVFFGAAPNVNAPVVNDEMVIRRRNVNAARLDRLICTRSNALYAALAAEY